MASHGYAPAPSVQRTRWGGPPWEGPAWDGAPTNGAATNGAATNGAAASGYRAAGTGYGGGVATAYPGTADRMLDG